MEDLTQVVYIFGGLIILLGIGLVKTSFKVNHENEKLRKRFRTLEAEANCRKGYHEYQVSAGRDGYVYVTCKHCGKVVHTPPQKEK